MDNEKVTIGVPIAVIIFTALYPALALSEFMSSPIAPVGVLTSAGVFIDQGTGDKYVDYSFSIKNTKDGQLFSFYFEFENNELTYESPYVNETVKGSNSLRGIFITAGF